MRRYLFLCFLLLPGFFHLYAQENISLDIVKTMQFNPGLNTVDIILENNGSVDFSGNIVLNLPKGLSSILGEQIPVKVLAGKKRFLSLKLQSVSLSTLKNKSFRLVLYNKEFKALQTRTVSIEVPVKRSVNINDNTPLQYFRQVGDSIHVKIRVTNNGTTDESIKILFSSPDRIGERNFKALDLQLNSGQDSLVQFSFIVEKYMMSLAQYTVRISGIYDNSDVFGNTSILFSNIASSRDFQRMFLMDNHTTQYARNFVDFQINNVFDSRKMYYLRSEGGYRLAEGKLTYGLGVNQFGDFKSNPNVNSTFIDYEGEGFQASLGNIQENVEAPLYGRGAKVSFWNPDKSNRISAGFVEKSNDLLGFYNDRSPGYTVFTRLILGEQRDERKQYEGQFFFDKNKYDSSESVLFANFFDLLPKGYEKDMRLTAFLASGLEYSYQNGNAKPSAALGVKWSGRSKAWTYSSDNFISTAYYTGNRRGGTQLQQRLGRNIAKGSYSLGYFYSEYKPEYISRKYLNFESNTSRLDMNINLPLSNFLSWNLQPSFNKENGMYWMDGNPVKLAVRSWQFMNTFNLRSGNYKHSLYITTETGLLSVTDELKDKFVLKGNFSYSYQGLNVFGAYQRGAFQVYEVISNAMLNQELGNRYSFGGGYGGTLIRAKINWNANAMSNFSSVFGDSYAANFNATYRVLKNTMLTSTFQYSYNKATSGADYAFTNMRVGVRQNLKSIDLDQDLPKTGNLKVFCFYDNNSNGEFDEGDAVATGYNFMVRNILFVTNNKGQSSFKKMPYGDYTLFFPMREGYQAVSKMVSVDRSTLQLEIPLQKIGLVSGRLSIDYDVNLSVEVDLRMHDYKVIAQDEQGRSFEARSNRDGEFQFSLPKGTYSFALDPQSFPDNISIMDNQRTAEVEISKTINLRPFVLQVKARNIEVKRFGSR